MPYLRGMVLPDPPSGYVRAEVVRRTDVTADLAVFRLRTPERLPFVPGQYVTLALPGAAGRPVKRAYSIVSAPHEPEIELVIELVEHGGLTPLLWSLRAGDVVWARKKIVGHFLLDAGRTRHVMACTVTGIAPFLSMLRAHRHAQATGEAVEDHRFLVLFGASAPVEHGPYRDEMAALAREGFVVAVPTISRPWLAPEWAGEQGRVEDVIRKWLDRLGWAGGDAAGYACGNPNMIENVKGILARAGFPKEHVHEEKYFTEEAPAAPASPPATAPAMTAPTVSAPVGAEQPRPKAPGGITLRTVPRPPDPPAG